MKHFKLFFALFAMLALGVGNAWGETVTLDFTSNKYSLVTSGTDTEKTFSVDGFTFGYKQCYYNSSKYLMLVKSKAVLYCTNPIGTTIQSIAVTYSSGTSEKGKLDVFFVDAKKDTRATTGYDTQLSVTKSGTATATNSNNGKNYFNLSTHNSNNIQVTKIVITYENTAGGDEPTPSPLLTPEVVSISLLLRS